MSDKRSKVLEMCSIFEEEFVTRFVKWGTFSSLASSICRSSYWTDLRVSSSVLAVSAAGSDAISLKTQVRYFRLHLQVKNFT